VTPPPFEADIRITRDLTRAGQLLKIEVLDHVIIGRPAHRSLRKLGFVSAKSQPDTKSVGFTCEWRRSGTKATHQAHYRLVSP
jgi:DNA repair protein RadC